jgi:hypothetical protein
MGSANAAVAGFARHRTLWLGSTHHAESRHGAGESRRRTFSVNYFWALMKSASFFASACETWSFRITPLITPGW